MGRQTFPGRKAKWQKGGGGNGCTEEEAGYNAGAGRQMILSVVLEVKLRRMNWKKQKDGNRWSQRAPQRSLLNQG